MVCVICMGLAHSHIVTARADVVRPALHGGHILAPTTAQRMRYHKYLLVYGKDIILVSKDMKALIQNSHVCHIFY
jgi:hypothetical protein